MARGLIDMTVIIDLVRHATSTAVEEAEASLVKVFGGRRDDVPLSVPRGRMEAMRLGCYAKAQGIRYRRPGEGGGS